MRARLIIVAVIASVVTFLSFVNTHRTFRQTRQLAHLEASYAADKNINTELQVELDDLRSGKHIASLVRVELSNFVPQEEQGKIIYVHEPADTKAREKYCIIDLIASRAQAKQVEIILD